MGMTTVVNVKYDEYDVYIGRGSIWGNPFKAKKYGREGCIEKYREYIHNRPNLLARLHELKGKRWAVTVNHYHVMETYSLSLQMLCN